MCEVYQCWVYRVLGIPCVRCTICLMYYLGTACCTATCQMLIIQTPFNTLATCGVCINAPHFLIHTPTYWGTAMCLCSCTAYCFSILHCFFFHIGMLVCVLCCIVHNHVCTYISALVCTHPCVSIHPCTCTYTPALVRTPLHLYVHPCTCTYTPALVRTPLHLYVHPCTCTYTPALVPTPACGCCPALPCSFVLTWVLHAYTRTRTSCYPLLLLHVPCYRTCMVSFVTLPSHMHAFLCHSLCTYILCLYGASVLGCTSPVHITYVTTTVNCTTLLSIVLHCCTTTLLHSFYMHGQRVFMMHAVVVQTRMLWSKQKNHKHTPPASL